MNIALDDSSYAQQILTIDQKRVLGLVSTNGTSALSVRDTAKKLGIASPLGVIRELISLGFLESIKREGLVFLVQIR